MNHAVSRMFLSTSLALSLGCGSYVKYDGDPPSTGNVSLGSTSDASTSIEVVDGALDHWAFSTVLSRVVKSEGAQTLVDYVGLKNDATLLSLFETYRSALANVDPDKLEGREQKLAFWYNAYNANVVAGVLAEYTGDPKWGVLSSGTFFSARRFKVAGIDIALDEIENGVVRGDTSKPVVNASPNKDKLLAWHASIWGDDTIDPRLHVAFNCASLGCPNLLQKAWDPKSLDGDLKAAMEAFLADPKKGAGPDGVSMLFEWYKPDWVGAAGSISAYIEQNRKGGLEGVDLGKTVPYDWTLNIVR